ncbi:hypothetical protein BRADI_3g26697v3 [Brachypodium distachyon]|uniref:K Homology domain-containing protein n=1 Tax=Brachypodium distachyon TaxID=15368 RepID=A0A0Q3FA60_BRADI|nr:hypothetical protein BRADI_3g26697v3 [Brachypodium distachyon]KQJ96695.1 hypothetical protein BRADI_3g26697v3 [Brachypodium distachyon]KQJ96700.1 hypothetical protein BRADI_3g26697v3 [Brachypodium distachyon]
MVDVHKNSTERWVTQMVRKSHGREGNEVMGTVMEQGFSHLDSADDTNCSAGENRYPGWPGTTVFRMLISSTKVGAIIGQKGERVRRLCEETKASVRVIGGHFAAAERVVLIFAKEQPDEPIPPAMDALLRVYQNIVNDDGLGMGSDSAVVTRILIPSEQALNLIGEQGSMINLIEEASQTDIRVLDCNLPPAALDEDRIVEIWGQPTRVRKALELVARHLRKYLVDRSVIPLFDPHVPMTTSHVDTSPCYYSDHPEGPLQAISSVYAEDLHRQPPWTDSCYPRGRYHVETDVTGYRWEAPTCFGRYRSVTPPCMGAYRQETSSPMEAYLSAPMGLSSHHNLTSYGSQSTPPIGTSAAAERIRSLISVYGQQTHPVGKVYQSANMGNHPHLETSLYGSEYHPSRLSPSTATNLPPTHGVSEDGLQASPSMRMHPPATVENLLHCRVSACGPDVLLPVVVPSLTSKSPAITSQAFMAEAAAASPGHNFDFIPSYLSPVSPRADTLTTSYAGRESGMTEQRLEMSF